MYFKYLVFFIDYIDHSINHLWCDRGRYLKWCCYCHDNHRCWSVSWENPMRLSWEVQYCIMLSSQLFLFIHPLKNKVILFLFFWHKVCKILGTALFENLFKTLYYLTQYMFQTEVVYSHHEIYINHDEISMRFNLKYFFKI